MFGRKSICFITGASRGFGESIALNFSLRFPSGSVMVLLARNESALELVKDSIHRQEKEVGVLVITRHFDQASTDHNDYQTIIPQCLTDASVNVCDFEQAIFVHNAGTIDPAVFVRSLPALDTISNCLTVNVTSVITLTVEFMKHFPPSMNFKRVVINISSLAAKEAFNSLAVYCTGV